MKNTEKKINWPIEIIKEGNGCKAGIIPITWLRGMKHGWGNGYVMIPVGHPWHGLNYFMIEVEVHGGLTFGKTINGEYWIGFDTAHYYDDPISSSKDFVIHETLKLLDQVIENATI